MNAKSIKTTAGYTEHSIKVNLFFMKDFIKNIQIYLANILAPVRLSLFLYTRQKNNNRQLLNHSPQNRRLGVQFTVILKKYIYIIKHLFRFKYADL